MKIWKRHYINRLLKQARIIIRGDAYLSRLWQLSSERALSVACNQLYLKYPKNGMVIILRGVGTSNVQTWDVYSDVLKLAINH